MEEVYGLQQLSSQFLARKAEDVECSDESSFSYSIAMDPLLFIAYSYINVHAVKLGESAPVN